jgi:hypothetical protein
MPDGAAIMTGSGRDRHTRRAPPAYLTPNSIAAVRELAELIAAGEWAPSSYRGADGRYVVEKIVLGIMHGAAVGLGPFAAVHAIAVIDGQPTIWGDGALALVERSGLIEDMREDYTLDDGEGLTAICTMRRRPWPTPITRRFSMAMAEGAGLTQKEGPWQTYPRRMLMMRARSWALRDGFADVLRGLSIREEVDDYDGITVALPEPASAGTLDRPSSRSGLSSRPRFADYISSRGAAGALRTPLAIDCRKRVAVTDPDPASSGAAGAGIGSRSPLVVAKTGVPSAAPVPPVGDAEPLENAGTNQAKSGAADRHCHHLDRGQNDEALARDRCGHDADGGSSAAYALIDAEGSLIDLGSLAELREGFDRLFADPHISAAQVLGLWESNAVARHEIERAFGIAALAEADGRRQSAERETTGHGSARHIKTGRSIAAIRSRHRNTKPAPHARHQLRLDPSSSDDELFELYRSRLLRLKRRRAKAATFIDFREANRPTEERLREHLPHLIAEIDATFAWAAVHAG